MTNRKVDPDQCATIKLSSPHYLTNYVHASPRLASPLISAHVRSCQDDIGSKLKMHLHMIWSIGNIQHFIDMIPTQPVHGIQHYGDTLVPTSTFSDVSGCFNNVPQGYPRPINDAPTVQVADLTSSIQDYCDNCCQTNPANGSETLDDSSFYAKLETFPLMMTLLLTFHGC